MPYDRDDDRIELTLEFRRESTSGQAIAFFQGDYEDTVDGKGKELWVWLPKSQIEIIKRKDDVCTVAVPEWLAKEKELI